ncbi:MAG: tRNA epoxyqueuosine(34) reductase QueG [Anaerolineae bacterium]|nr:tRNA epoxyqueuosine(34) reductase QueG [Anaerolineae bacterium]
MDSEHLQELANQAGLDRVGVVPAGPTPGWEQYRRWVAQGYAGEMAYLTRPDSIARRNDPRVIMPETQSVLVVAATYDNAPLPPLLPQHGRVSRYAWGQDYHRWLLRRLENLVEQIRKEVGDFPCRCYVDTGPVLERAWAQAAGLGWAGKNTCLIHPQLGSRLFLGVALLGTASVPTTKADRPERGMPDCGSCTRCLEVCPTQALIAPGVLDARRCLSYLTIENRGAIPVELRPALGDSVFGCDLCQDVCPWNQKAQRKSAGSPENHTEAPAHATLDLLSLLAMTPETFRARFRDTPIWRATPEGLARNAAVVLGNQKDPAARAGLTETAIRHPSALVREHALWALEQLPGTG